jgi:hypothetical protein
MRSLSRLVGDRSVKGNLRSKTATDAAAAQILEITCGFLMFKIGLKSYSSTHVYSFTSDL